MHLHPQISPIFKKGTNGAAALLVHGFTGTPDSMRPLANRLHSQGYTVLAPLLAGHGTTPELCAHTTWQDWYHDTEKAYRELKEKHSKIFVAGLSLGALLTLKLSLDDPQNISAIACLATPMWLPRWVRTLLPFVMHSPAKWFWKYQKKFDVDIKDPEAKKNFWNYDRMPLTCIAGLMELQLYLQKNMAQIQVPLLLIHSRHDSTAPYESMSSIAAHVGSAITETITLENSYHVITIDYEKELVAKKTCEFFGRFL